MPTITLGTNAYVEVSDIQSIHQHRTIAAGSKPSLEQVENWIIRAFNISNGKLEALGYVTPVTEDDSPDSIEILKEINLSYVGSRVEMAVFQAGIGGVPEVSKSLMDDWVRFWKDLKNGDMALTDAVKAADAVKLANERDPVAQFSKDEYGVERTPVFTRGRKW